MEVWVLLHRSHEVEVFTSADAALKFMREEYGVTKHWVEDGKVLKIIVKRGGGQNATINILKQTVRE